MNEKVRRLSPTGISVDLVKRTQLVRRLRSEIVAEDLFSDPAWDMLLELFARELAVETILASELTTLSNVKEATALRWIDALNQKGLVDRTPNSDGSLEIGLSAFGSAQMQRYFLAVATVSVPL